MQAPLSRSVVLLSKDCVLPGQCHFLAAKEQCLGKSFHPLLQGGGMHGI